MNNVNRVKRHAALSTFRKMAQEETDECIVWKYCSSNMGYGQVLYKGEMEYTHRLALKERIGSPPPDKPQALHKPGICHNTACFNYRHLYWGDRVDNARDRNIDGTQNTGSAHGGAKLTEKDILLIRSDSRPQRQIARDWGLNPSNVSCIKTRKTWKHVLWVNNIMEIVGLIWAGWMKS